MDGELKKIKKVYGEDFAKLCRELFPTILEKEGLLFEILIEKFAPNKNMYTIMSTEDRKDKFQNWVIDYVNKNKNAKIEKLEYITNKTPDEIFNDLGYDFFRCETNEDVLNFKKYYEEDESLCTFNEPNRINTHHIFFAVKKNISEIRRENFLNPERQDEYGTSVLSIQFSKKNNALSIKNRYNHSVSGCDATFSNNLDNISKGLKHSFEKFYNIKYNPILVPIENLGFVTDDLGRYHKLNFYDIVTQIKYCENNVIFSNNGVKSLDKGRFDVFDYFVLDKKELKVYSSMNDCFINDFNDAKKIDIVVNKDNKEREFTVYKNNNECFSFTINKHNKIIKYYNEYAKEIGNNFLINNRSLTEICCPNVEKIGARFLWNGISIKELDFPKLTSVGNGFVETGVSLTNLKLPKLELIGNNFLKNNEGLKTINLPSVEKVGSNFLLDNIALKTLEMPNLKEIGDNFLGGSSIIKNLDLSKLKKTGNNFFNYFKFDDELLDYLEF